MNLNEDVLGSNVVGKDTPKKSDREAVEGMAGTDHRPGREAVTKSLHPSPGRIV